MTEIVEAFRQTFWKFGLFLQNVLQAILRVVFSDDMDICSFIYEFSFDHRKASIHSVICCLIWQSHQILLWSFFFFWCRQLIFIIDSLKLRVSLLRLLKIGVFSPFKLSGESAPQEFCSFIWVFIEFKWGWLWNMKILKEG